MLPIFKEAASKYNTPGNQVKALLDAFTLSVVCYPSSRKLLPSITLQGIRLKLCLMLLLLVYLLPIFKEAASKYNTPGNQVKALLDVFTLSVVCYPSSRKLLPSITLQGIRLKLCLMLLLLV